MNHKTTIYKLIASILWCLNFTACRNDTTLFESLNANETGIQFSNNVTESEEENILNYEYFYNGGGVAAGDFNNDGLADLYFTGNQVDNKLYLNKGKFSFEDITQKAGVAGRKGAWKTGVSIADVNADGWLDIYVCYSGLRDSTLRKNQLFINNHNLTFSEEAQKYGLDDAGYSTQATFLDYDLDGDLDCFLINHNLAGYQRKEASVMRASYDYNAADKLFRNEGNQKFTDVSAQSGIKGNPLGFGLGVAVSDVNQDGFPDIYVANDYVEDDYLYINQKNGTFKDELRERIEHTSYSAMGIDIADLNNDQLPDIFTLDMLPEDNARQKLLLWADSWNTYQAQLQNGFWHANMRNMLQINQGKGNFAEIGTLAGVSNTDWSWGTLLADFDMDGYKDIFVTNGIGKDYTNADFIKFFNQEEENGLKKPILEYLKEMPTSQTKNYIFKNNGSSIQFTNQQKAWGFDKPTVASGAIYADLDNDGDLEIVTNNLNETAHIYKNQSRELNPDAKFLKIHLKGIAQNAFGIGAKVSVSVGKNTQVQEVSSTHGFQSSSISDLVFGFAEMPKSCNIKVDWGKGKIQELKNIPLNQTLTIEAKNALNKVDIEPNEHTIFTEIPPIDFTHQINPINNFDHQIMLPTHYSYTGPRMAIGDVNMDGKNDTYICGTTVKAGGLLLQNQGEIFKLITLKNNHLSNNQDAVIADFNGDKFPDLYITNGNYANAQFEEQNDELWLNDGKANFTKTFLPEDKINSSCVKAGDFDKDGDIDLFVGGHIRPNWFPEAEESFIYQNDGKAHFKKISLGVLGLVTDATITDVDKDGYPEIIVVGEWMSPIILKNKKGRFSNSPIPNLSGWNYRIEKADLDNDGDDDLILGNLGTNTQIRASESEPATLIYDDFDQNGTVDFFMNYYIQGKTYPACSRDEMAEQMPLLKKKFPDYKTFSEASIEQFFDSNQLEKAHKKQITNLKTIILENRKGEFIPHDLPIEAQASPVYAIAVEDFNQDGKKDLLLMGNNSKFRLRIGKVDANHGVILMNKGNLNGATFRFENISPTKSGLYVRGDVRDVKTIGKTLLIGMNDGKLKVYRNN